MQNIHDIVVPIDFSQHTDSLIEFAKGVAEKFAGQITFLHVAEKIAAKTTYYDVYPPNFVSVDEEILDKSRERMAELVRKSQGSLVACQGEVLQGDVVDMIVDYVTEKKSDLIIIGTHGYRGIQKILLGSVADSVVKRAPCPILIFNPYKGKVA